jgi:hypothetical protein
MGGTLRQERPSDHAANSKLQTQTSKNTERFVYSGTPAQSSAASKQNLASRALARRNGPSSVIAHQAQCFKRRWPCSLSRGLHRSSSPPSPRAVTDIYRIRPWPASLLVLVAFLSWPPPSRPFLHLSPRSLLPSSAASASSTCSCCLDQLIPA